MRVLGVDDTSARAKQGHDEASTKEKGKTAVQSPSQVSRSGSSSPRLGRNPGGGKKIPERKGRGRGKEAYQHIRRIQSRSASPRLNGQLSVQRGLRRARHKLQSKKGREEWEEMRNFREPGEAKREGHSARDKVEECVAHSSTPTRSRSASPRCGRLLMIDQQSARRRAKPSSAAARDHSVVVGLLNDVGNKLDRLTERIAIIESTMGNTCSVVEQVDKAVALATAGLALIADQYVAPGIQTQAPITPVLAESPAKLQALTMLDKVTTYEWKSKGTGGEPTAVASTITSIAIPVNTVPPHQPTHVAVAASGDQDINISCINLPANNIVSPDRNASSDVYIDAEVTPNHGLNPQQIAFFRACSASGEAPLWQQLDD